MSFFRNRTTIIATLGTGAVICIMYWRMTSRILSEIQRLNLVIVGLQTEVTELREKLDSISKRPRRAGSGFFSLGTSSDDDLYEEANEGSDFESLREIEDQLTVTLDKSSEKKVASDSGENVFGEVDKLVEGTDEDKEKAFEILKRNKNKYPGDVEFLWRMSKSTFQVAQILGAQGDTEKKKEQIYEALNIAQSAIQLDDECANAHKWYAITIGSIGEYEGTQQKIKNGYAYKEHIEKAIVISPNDPSNHYLLGRWCWSVYMLSWLEKKAAAALFATPPSASIDETLSHFMKADELKPGKWKDNILFIAKCYIEKRQYKEAVKWLVKAQNVPTVSQDDKEAQVEVTALLDKYKSY